MNEQEEAFDLEQDLPWLAEVRRQNHEATKGMTPEEEVAWWQSEIARLRTERGIALPEAKSEYAS